MPTEGPDWPEVDPTPNYFEIAEGDASDSDDSLDEPTNEQAEERDDGGRDAESS